MSFIENEIKEIAPSSQERINRKDKINNEIINIVLRQTDMSREVAENKLKENNYNFHKVIKDYMNPNPINVESKSINVQQEIFKEIRTMMDSGERNRRFQKELNKKIEKINENITNNE